VVVINDNKIFVEEAFSRGREYYYNKLKNSKVKVIVDGRNCLDKEKIKSLGIIYKGIGR